VQPTEWVLSQNGLHALERIAGLSEFDSVRFLRTNAYRLTDADFVLLLGRAIRQPDLLKWRLDLALKGEGK
jgi:hypothetical protein